MDRAEEEVATAFLISRAEEIDQGDPAYLAGLQRWMRTDPVRSTVSRWRRSRPTIRTPRRRSG